MVTMMVPRDVHLPCDKIEVWAPLTSGTHIARYKPRLSGPCIKCFKGGMHMMFPEHQEGTVRGAQGSLGNQDEGDI